MVMKLIFVNAGVFLLFGIIYFVGFFLNAHSFYDWLQNQFELHTSVSIIVRKPWTLITHMFTHFEPGHILGNMLYLYFFGQIFILYLGESKVLPLYIFTGLFGASLTIFATHFISAIGKGQDHAMVGASGAILGIIFAVVAINPEHRVRIFFLGEVKIMYVALVPLFIDILSIPDGNAGGYIAHLGGAISGYYYIKLLQNGIDIFSPFEKLKTPFRRSSKVKVTYKNPDYKRSSEKNIGTNEQQRVDEILDKIARSGYDSLTKEEKDFLFNYSKK